MSTKAGTAYEQPPSAETTYEPGDNAPGTTEALLNEEQAAEEMTYGQRIPTSVVGLRRALKLGYGPESFPAPNGKRLTTREALQRWSRSRRFQVSYQSKLAIGTLPRKNPTRDYVDIIALLNPSDSNEND